MTIQHQEKIIILWIVFLLGLLFHTQLGLMPLFHDLSIVSAPVKDLSEIASVLWLMLAFFVIPMAAIVGTLLMNSHTYRKLHFGLTILYTMLNISHLVADLFVVPIAWYQIALMVILVLLGLLINLVSFQWIRARSSGHRLQQS